MTYNASPDLRPQSLRDTVTVVITEPVSGSRRAYARRTDLPKPGPLDSVVVNTLALETARELCGRDQRIILISRDVVEVVNRSNTERHRS